MLRKPAVYPSPRYKDPNDKRLVRLIGAAKTAKPRSVNIIGVPFDGAVLGRKGSAGGPGGIRSAMTAFSNYNVELGESLEGVQMCDLGDVVVGDEVDEAHSQIESEVAGALDKSSLLILLGGDNSVSLPALRANARRFGKLGLVVFDSHFDLRGKIDGKPTSGSSYGLAIHELSGLDPLRVVEIGIHGFLNSKSYFDRARSLGITIITSDEVRKSGPEAAAKKAMGIASQGADALYLSLDLDAVDQSQVSGVSAPSAGGLGAEDVFMIVHEIAKDERLKCADIVELAPSLDVSGRSERVAATLLVYMAAGFAHRK